jgi:lipid-binding SYLF domain-containing protein
MRNTFLLTLAIALSLSSGCMGPAGSTSAEQRASAMEMHDETLAILATRRDDIRSEIESAPGYAVFTGFSIHPGLFTAASGYGVLIDNRTQEATHLKLWRAAVGPGLAIKSYRFVAVIHDAHDVERFASGGGFFGALLEASFKFGDFGGSAGHSWEFTSGADLYYWTEQGFSLEVAVGGGRISPNEDLEPEP